MSKNSLAKGLFCLVIIVFVLVAGNNVLASGGSSVNNQPDISIDFLWIAIILLLAKFASLVERFGQPAVLGELVIGVIIGNLSLIGINIFEPIKTNEIIAFLSELGVIILLFQIGLESNINEMKKVGARAFLVACVGVFAPFVLGAYIFGPLFFPGMSLAAYLFIGAALTATSVGITARVFSDLNFLQAEEAKIVLGAAVIDDILGLVILAVISAVVTSGAVGLGTIFLIATKAILFLISAITAGQIFAPYIGKAFAKIHTGIGMKFTLALAFGLILAYFSKLAGLAPIVGAFAAGLVLDPMHFRYFKDHKIVRDIKDGIVGAPNEIREKINRVIEAHSQEHVKELIEPIGYFLVPIFFVLTGINVKIDTMFDSSILLISLGILLVACFGKVISGLVAGKVNKLIVGIGMIPRGEVGLIFAVTGLSLGVIPESVFSMIIIMVIMTTLLTPPLLAHLLKKHKNAIS